MLGIHLAADRPDGAGPPLDPDHDPLGTAAVVATFHDPFGEAPGCRGSLHALDYTIALASGNRRCSQGRVFVPVVALAERGADRAVRDPRAPPRPPARRDPAGQLRHEPLHARADPAAARPARRGARARRRRRRRREGDTSSRSYRASSTTRAAAARSHAASPFDLNSVIASSLGAAGQSAGDDVLKLVHRRPVEDAALDRLDQIAGLELRLRARVGADERRAAQHLVVELARGRRVRPDRADERAVAQPLAEQHRLARTWSR